MRQAYLTCLMLFSVVSLKTAVENQYFYGLTNLGIGMRGALSTVSGCIERASREGSYIQEEGGVGGSGQSKGV